MKRGWRILLLIAAFALVAVGLAMLWPGEREPEYKGRRLSSWIESQSPKRYPGDFPERIAAVRHIGTNGLPYLLKWIEGAELPKTYTRLDFAALKVMDPETARRWMSYRQRKFYRAMGAQWAFEILGTDAAPARPELIRLSHSTNQFVARLASSAFGSIKKDSTQILNAYSRDPNAPGWANWTNSVGGEGTK